MSEIFIDALTRHDLESVRMCSKADLHNHFVLGGNRQYLMQHTGKNIQPIRFPLHSMDEMHAWNSENLGNSFETTEGRKILIQATFQQLSFGKSRRFKEPSYRQALPQRCGCDDQF